MKEFHALSTFEPWVTVEQIDAGSQHVPTAFEYRHQGFLDGPIGQGGINLAQGNMWILKVQFFRAPAVSLVRGDQLYELP